MDTATGSGLMEEFELMKQAKYRVYMQNIDKALKNFEYSSEWADLISALGKLNKVSCSDDVDTRDAGKSKSGWLRDNQSTFCTLTSSVCRR